MQNHDDTTKAAASQILSYLATRKPVSAMMLFQKHTGADFDTMVFAMDIASTLQRELDLGKTAPPYHPAQLAERIQDLEERLGEQFRQRELAERRCDFATAESYRANTLANKLLCIISLESSGCALPPHLADLKEKICTPPEQPISPEEDHSDDDINF
jgi:hypothetical protein